MTDHAPCPDVLLVHQDDGTVFVLLDGRLDEATGLSFHRQEMGFRVQAGQRMWVKENAPEALWQAIREARCHCVCCHSDEVYRTIAVELKPHDSTPEDA
jgi:hypothetical protein